ILEGVPRQEIRPVAEVFVDHAFGQSLLSSGKNTAATAYSALVGAIWEARENLALDMGLRVAREDEMRAVEVRLGFTWTFELWKKGRGDEHGRRRVERRWLALH